MTGAMADFNLLATLAATIEVRFWSARVLSRLNREKLFFKKKVLVCEGKGGRLCPIKVLSRWLLVKQIVQNHLDNYNWNSDSC